MGKFHRLLIITAPSTAGRQSRSAAAVGPIGAAGSTDSAPAVVPTMVLGAENASGSRKRSEAPWSTSMQHQVRAFLANHDCGGIGVTRSDARHDRGVDHA